jgi:hypothetical protein
MQFSLTLCCDLCSSISQQACCVHYYNLLLNKYECIYLPQTVVYVYTFLHPSFYIRLIKLLSPISDSYICIYCFVFIVSCSYTVAQNIDMFFSMNISNLMFCLFGLWELINVSIYVNVVLKAWYSIFLAC